MENTFKLGPLQQQWVDSLRNNPDRQLKGALGNTYFGEITYRACCLGEAAIICGLGEWMGPDLVVKYPDLNNPENILNDKNFLTGQTFKAMGLRSAQGDPNQRQIEDFPVKGMTKTLYSLSHLNDETMTWPELATHIEIYAEYYFTEPK